MKDGDHTGCVGLCVMWLRGVGKYYRVPTTGKNQGKQGTLRKINPCREKSGNLGEMGKIREKSGNFTKTCQGNIREFSACFII